MGSAPRRLTRRAPPHLVRGLAVIAQHHVRQAPGAVGHQQALHRGAHAQHVQLHAVAVAQHVRAAVLVLRPPPGAAAVLLARLPRRAGSACAWAAARARSSLGQAAPAAIALFPLVAGLLLQCTEQALHSMCCGLHTLSTPAACAPVPLARAVTPA